MHRDAFIRLKRAGPPSDPKSEHELMVFASEAGRAGQVDHLGAFHLFAWVDEISGGGGDGGIQFDTAPQEGNWLYVKGNDGGAGGGSPNGYEIEFYATGADSGLKLGSGYNILLEADHWVTLRGTGLVEINSDSGSVALNAHSAIRMYLDSANQLEWVPTLGAFAGFMLDTTGGYLHIQANGIRMQSADTKSVAIYSSTYMDVGAANNLSLGAAGSDSAAVLLQAADNVSGTGFLGAIGLDLIARGGVYSTYAYPGIFATMSRYAGGSRFEIIDRDGGGAFFQITLDPSGAVTYHIKSGASWIADL